MFTLVASGSTQVINLTDELQGLRGSQIHGTSDAEDITASLTHANLILAHGGNDTLHGGAVGDDLRGGNDNDLVFGEGGGDSLNGDAGNDTLWGGQGDDTIRGDGENDQIFGEDGNDSISDTSGTSTTIDAGAGDDSISVANATSLASGSISGGTDTDTLEVYAVDCRT